MAMRSLVKSQAVLDSRVGFGVGACAKEVGRGWLLTPRRVWINRATVKSTGQAGRAKHVESDQMKDTDVARTNEGEDNNAVV